MNQLKSNDIVETLERSRIVAVVRASKSEQVPFICDALMKGGVSTIELTLTIPNAIDAIAQTCQRLGPDACVGAGTVLTEDQCRAVIDAGARFIVSPIGNVELIDIAHGHGLPTMIGAYSPTEAFQVWSAGSDFVKIFPADTLGPKYVKALKAPLKELKIVPTGGVDLDNIQAFMEAGCSAAGVGSPLVKKEFLEKEDWKSLEQLARQFREKLDSLRG